MAHYPSRSRCKDLYSCSSYSNSRGMPTKIKSGEVIKPPPIPNKPEINPIPIPREIRR